VRGGGRKTRWPRGRKKVDPTWYVCRRLQAQRKWETRKRKDPSAAGGKTIAAKEGGGVENSRLIVLSIKGPFVDIGKEKEKLRQGGRQGYLRKKKGKRGKNSRMSTKGGSTGREKIYVTPHQIGLNDRGTTVHDKTEQLCKVRIMHSQRLLLPGEKRETRCRRRKEKPQLYMLHARETPVEALQGKDAGKGKEKSVLPDI